MNKSLFLLLLSASLYSQSLPELVYQIRDPKTSAPHFRNCLEKIGEHLALKIEMPTEEKEILTLTGAVATHHLPSESPVIVTILRAGLPLSNGVQKIFPDAETGFIAMARNEETLLADSFYIALPSLNNKYVILTDTMLATGGSFLNAIEIIKPRQPKKIVIVSAIASEAGIQKIAEKYPDIQILTAVTDPILNNKGYIVPGLGDAGDRCYGAKEHLDSSPLAN